jgi:hypothetical protein
MYYDLPLLITFLTSAIGVVMEIYGCYSPMFKMCLPLLAKKKKNVCTYLYKNLDWFLMGKGEFVLEILSLKFY